MEFTKIVLILSVCMSSVYCFEDKTLFEYLNTTSDFSLLARLLTEANLGMMLRGQGPFTILAPSNAALSSLDPDVLVTLGHNDLLLKSVLNYHILNGFQLIPEFRDGSEEMTLNGQTIKVSIKNNGIVLNNSTKKSSNQDVVLNNGVIHPIDTVLIPPVFSTNNLAAELIIKDNVAEFFTQLMIMNLTSLIEGGEYTVFAPTNDAIAQVFGTVLYTGMPHAAHYTQETAKYHIVPGARTSSQLKDGQILYTLHGTPLHVKKSAAGVFVEDSRVIEADIGASNGVIHIVDHVVFPVDLLDELQRELSQLTTPRI